MCKDNYLWLRLWQGWHFAGAPEVCRAHSYNFSARLWNIGYRVQKVTMNWSRQVSYILLYQIYRMSQIALYNQGQYICRCHKVLGSSLTLLEIRQWRLKYLTSNKARILKFLSSVFLKLLIRHYPILEVVQWPSRHSTEHPSIRIMMLHGLTLLEYTSDAFKKICLNTPY